MTHIQAPVSMEPIPIDEASIVSGNPMGTGTTLYTTPDGRTTVGLYRCTPGTFRHTLETVDCTHLLSGHIVIQADDGETIDATAGDTYILPAGKRVLIDVQETITDIYVTWSAEE
jgi:uncharacterized cupin superfamily protein